VAPGNAERGRGTTMRNGHMGRGEPVEFHSRGSRGHLELANRRAGGSGKHPELPGPAALREMATERHAVSEKPFPGTVNHTGSCGVSTCRGKV